MTRRLVCAPADRRRASAGISLVFLLAFPLSGGSAESSAIDLRTVIRLAREENALARAQGRAVEKAELRVAEARATRVLPELRLNAIFGLVPEARGDVFYSPDQRNDLDGFGPFLRADIQLAQPVFTFGRIRSGIRAAEGAHDAEVASREVVLRRLSLEAIRAFWGVRAAAEALPIASDARRQYARFIEQVASRRADDASGVDDADYMEAKTFHYTIEQVYEVVLERKRVATAGLRAVLGLSAAVEVDSAPERSPACAFADGDLKHLTDKAERSSPEILALQSGERARSAQTALARAERFPLVLFGAQLGYAHAGNRTPQPNPFSYDNYNYRTVAAGLGLRWDLNFLRRDLEVRRQELERSQLVDLEDAARVRTRLEVEQALAEARRAQALLDAAHDSTGAAQNWLMVTRENWDLGIGEIGRLLRAYEAYFRISLAEIENRYQRNVALARLGLAVGGEDLYLAWVEGGEARVH